jgi:hypothetical protein
MSISGERRIFAIRRILYDLRRKSLGSGVIQIEGSIQSCRLVRIFVKARFPAELHHGLHSIAAPVVRRVSSPVTRPVLGDIPTAHKFSLSPVCTVEITVSCFAAQHPGASIQGTGVRDLEDGSMSRRASSS